MAKDKLKAALETKGPGALRQAGATAERQIVQPIDIISASIPVVQNEREEDEEKRTEKANDKKDTKKSTVKALQKTDIVKRPQFERLESVSKKRSKKPRLKSDQDIHALLALDKRITERYSFEIYTDQKEDIALLCERYARSTGQKLSASRLIREVLDYFLPGALKAFEEENG